MANVMSQALSDGERVGAPGSAVAAVRRRTGEGASVIPETHSQ